MEQFIVYTIFGFCFGIFMVTDEKFQRLAAPERDEDPFFFDFNMVLAMTFFWPIPLLRSLFNVLSKN